MNTCTPQSLSKIMVFIFHMNGDSTNTFQWWLYILCVHNIVQKKSAPSSSQTNKSTKFHAYSIIFKSIIHWNSFTSKHNAISRGEMFDEALNPDRKYTTTNLNISYIIQRLIVCFSFSPVDILLLAIKKKQNSFIQHQLPLSYI